VRVVTFSRIKKYTKAIPTTKTALEEWYYKTSKAEWKNVTDIKNTFNTIDYVGNNRFVFDIKGNHYRLVAIIIFASQKVYIRFIGTHAEYDKINCTTI